MRISENLSEGKGLQSLRQVLSKKKKAKIRLSQRGKPNGIFCSSPEKEQAACPGFSEGVIAKNFFFPDWERAGRFLPDS